MRDALFILVTKRKADSTTGEVAYFHRPFGKPLTSRERLAVGREREIACQTCTSAESAQEF